MPSARRAPRQDHPPGDRDARVRETLEINVQHPERWTQVKAGDTVTGRFSEALAIAVQAPPPRVSKQEPALTGPAR